MALSRWGIVYFDSNGLKLTKPGRYRYGYKYNKFDYSDIIKHFFMDCVLKNHGEKMGELSMERKFEWYDNSDVFNFQRIECTGIRRDKSIIKDKRKTQKNPFMDFEPRIIGDVEKGSTCSLYGWFFIELILLIPRMFNPLFDGGSDGQLWRSVELNDGDLIGGRKRDEFLNVNSGKNVLLWKEYLITKEKIPNHYVVFAKNYEMYLKGMMQIEKNKDKRKATTQGGKGKGKASSPPTTTEGNLFIDKVYEI